MSGIKFIFIIVIVTVISLCTVEFVFLYFDSEFNEDFNSGPYYRESAPDGVYLQKDWGSIQDNNCTWFFAICGHSYLGPLHGEWQVADELLCCKVTHHGGSK